MMALSTLVGPARATLCADSVLTCNGTLVCCCSPAIVCVCCNSTVEFCNGATGTCAIPSPTPSATASATASLSFGATPSLSPSPTWTPGPSSSGTASPSTTPTASAAPCAAGAFGACVGNATDVVYAPGVPYADVVLALVNTTQVTIVGSVEFANTSTLVLDQGAVVVVRDGNATFGGVVRVTLLAGGDGTQIDVLRVDNGTVDLADDASVDVVDARAARRTCELASGTLTTDGQGMAVLVSVDSSSCGHGGASRTITVVAPVVAGVLVCVCLCVVVPATIAIVCLLVVRRGRCAWLVDASGAEAGPRDTFHRGRSADDRPSADRRRPKSSF